MHRLVAGVEVEHAGRRWRVHQPLGPDAVLLQNDAGEIVSTDPIRVTFPDTEPRKPAPLVLPEQHYSEAVGSLLVELRNPGSVTGVSLGGFATKEIAYVLRQDEQLANRFELLTLPRWQFADVESGRLLATFERHMPLRQRSGLMDPALAREILLAADGLIGGVAGILRQAAVAAIRCRDVQAVMHRSSMPLVRGRKSPGHACKH